MKYNLQIGDMVQVLGEIIYASDDVLVLKLPQFKGKEQRLEVWRQDVRLFPPELVKVASGTKP